MLFAHPIVTRRVETRVLVLALAWVTLLMAFAPPAATAAFSTRLEVRADDNTSSYYRPSPDESVVIEDELWASASVAYDNRLSEPYKYPMAAASSASFDLRTGETKFYVEAMGSGAGVTANIDLSDTIYPVWASGSTNAMDIQLTWTVSGDYTVYGWNNTLGDWVEGGSPFNLALMSTFSYSVDGGTLVKTPWNQYNLTDGYQTWTQTVHFDPTLNSSITIGESIHAWIQTYNSQKAIADFSHTGLIEVVLPEGASYTCDSGVFLTGLSDDGSATVPAPGAVLLGSLGAGLVGWMRRRTRS